MFVCSTGEKNKRISINWRCELLESGLLGRVRSTDARENRQINNKSDDSKCVNDNNIAHR